jgi:hypothetical protein
MKNRFLLSAIAVSVVSMMTTLPAQMANAKESAFNATILRGFGCGVTDHVSPNGWCKMLVKSNRTGNRFLVWYADSLEAPVQSNIIVTYDDYYGWLTVSNPQNGRNAAVGKVLKVNP